MTHPTPSSVVVAMSGGVDSALAAALLKEQGWTVRGLHLSLPASRDEQERKRRTVERTADHLGIDLDVVDAANRFEARVIRPFVQGYLAGRTPSPCVVCNPEVKFHSLLAWADECGVPFVATGHYARVCRLDDGQWALLRGRDPGKEQSYFLHRLGQRALGRTLFPLGGVSKEETRRMAGDRRLPSGSSPESQEVCFLSGEDYRSFLARRGGPVSGEGDIVDLAGKRLGSHQGAFRYTVGQRRGLGIASERPYHVVALRPDRNQVVVGRREDLLRRRAEAVSVVWTSGDPEEVSFRAEAQVRYRHAAAPGRVERTARDRIRFVFDEPQLAVAPGQALVCYHGDRVLGGGWIVGSGDGPLRRNRCPSSGMGAWEDET